MACAAAPIIEGTSTPTHATTHPSNPTPNTPITPAYHTLKHEEPDMLSRGQRLGKIGDSQERWSQYYKSVMSVDHVGTLRHALEPQEMFNLPAGEALAISGNNIIILKLLGWWESPLWSEVFGRTK